MWWFVSQRRRSPQRQPATTAALTGQGRSNVAVVSRPPSQPQSQPLSNQPNCNSKQRPRRVTARMSLRPRVSGPPRWTCADLVGVMSALLTVCRRTFYWCKSRDRRQDALALPMHLLRVLSSALPLASSHSRLAGRRAHTGTGTTRQHSGSGNLGLTRPRSRSSADTQPIAIARSRSGTVAGSPSSVSPAPSPSPPSQVILGSPAPMPGIAAAAAAAAAAHSSGSTALASAQGKKPLPAGIDPVAFAAYRWLQARFDDALVRASRLQQTLRPDTRIGNPDEVMFRTTLDTVRAAATDELRGQLSQSISKYRESLTMLVTLDRSADRMHAPAEDRDVLSSCTFVCPALLCTLEPVLIITMRVRLDIATVSRRLHDALQRSSIVAVPPLSAAHTVLTDFE